MTDLVIEGPASVAGQLTLPGDKSISHRALMLAATATGRSWITNLATGSDVKSTVRCLTDLGVSIRDGVVDSPGLSGWRQPRGPLDCGNSGTTMRLLSGLLCRCRWESTLDGDASLRTRPMDRLAGPLGQLGASIESENGFPPVTISKGNLRGATVSTGIASAQVKSALILAALGADGATRITEPARTRDHTERLLLALGAPIKFSDGAISIEPFDVHPFDLDVAGDVSSAAFLISAALLGGCVRLENVLLNPNRISFLNVFEQMGAAIKVEETHKQMGEPVGRIEAERSVLRGIEVTETAPLIDELMLIAVLATQAEGRTVVSGAGELRVKETDRLSAICDGLKTMGANISEEPDGFVIEGPTPLAGAHVDGRGDHRVVMSLAVAGLAAKGTTTIAGAEAAAVSWPEFEPVLRSLSQ